MEITTKDYKITVDKYQYQLQLGSVIEDSDKLEDKSLVGTIRYGSATYHSTLEQVFNKLMKLRLASDESITSLAAVTAAYQQMTEEVRKLDFPRK